LKEEEVVCSQSRLVTRAPAQKIFPAQLPPFGSAGSRIISIPICSRKNALSSGRAARSLPIHPSIGGGCSVFCVQPFFTANISYNDLVWKPRQPHLICHYGRRRRRRIQRDPFEPLAEGKIERRQEITCSGLLSLWRKWCNSHR
jgi:hypothetical protein